MSGLGITEARRLHFRLLDEEWDALAGRPDLVEEVPCPVGCTAAPVVLFEKRGSTFVRCPDCGLVFLNPQLTETAMVDHFTRSEAWVIWARDVLPDPEQQAFDRRKYAAAMDHVGGLIDGPGRVLDVGANSGIFLSIARERGWDIAGIEPSEGACRVARDLNGVDLWNGMFRDFEAEPGSFDLITFWASFEYDKRPAVVVEKAVSLLRPGGLLLIYISGNCHSLVMRMLREKCVGYVFNRPWSFGPESLDRLVLKGGTSLIERHSVIPSLDVIERYLDYGDGYGDAVPALFREPERRALQAVIEAEHMGYKFQSIYRKGGAA